MIRSLLLMVFLAIGCSPSHEERSFKDIAPITAALRAGEHIRFYEGLPHPSFEPKLLESELALKPTTHISGYPFYAEQVSVDEDHGKAILGLLTNRKSYRPLPENLAKACGAFHPDYGVTWRTDDIDYYALLCFGCGEIKAGGDNLRLHCEFRDKTKGDLVNILRPYRNNRPERKVEEGE